MDVDVTGPNQGLVQGVLLVKEAAVVLMEVEGEVVVGEDTEVVAAATVMVEGVVVMADVVAVRVPNGYTSRLVHSHMFLISLYGGSQPQVPYQTAPPPAGYPYGGGTPYSQPVRFFITISPSSI